MKLHGAATMLFLFLLGAMLNTHIRRAIRSRRNLATGWIVIGLIVFLVISAYGLYYLSGETARLIWSTVHWILGVVFAAGIVLHIFFGRRTIR